MWVERHLLSQMDAYYPRGTIGGEELAELMGKAQQVYQTIVEIQQSITHITDTLSR